MPILNSSASSRNAARELPAFKQGRLIECEPVRAHHPDQKLIRNPNIICFGLP